MFVRATSGRLPRARRAGRPRAAPPRKPPGTACWTSSLPSTRRSRDSGTTASSPRSTGWPARMRSVDVSWRLRETVAIMHRAGRVTAGRFDPTVLGVLEELGELGASVFRGHDVTESARSLGPVAIRDGSRLERPRRIRAPERPLDTGGIGKGLALRWAGRRALGLLPARSRLLLDAGGDVVAVGDGEPGVWQIGIEDPVAIGDPGAGPIAVAELRRRRGRNLVHRRPPVAGARWHRGASPHRPGASRAGTDGPDRGDGRRQRSRVGRGLDEGAVPRGSSGHPG